MEEGGLIMNESFEAYIDKAEINELEPGEWTAKLNICITGVIPADVAKDLQRLDKYGQFFMLSIEG